MLGLILLFPGAGPAWAETFFGADYSVVPTPRGADPIAVTDLNGDGLVDLLLDAGRDGLWLAAARRSEGLESPIALESVEQLRDIQAADLDGDPYLDLVGRDPGIGGVAFRLGRARGFGEVERIPGSSPASGMPYVGDLDGDGLDDVVTVDYGAVGGLTIHLRLPGGWKPPLRQDGEFFDIAVVDLDGDGARDIRVSHYTRPLGVTQRVLHRDSGWQLSTADTLRLDGEAFPGPGASVVLDVDHDGVPELVYAKSGHGIAMARAAGAGAWRTFWTGAEEEISPYRLTAADADDDGWVDLVAADHITSRVAIFRNDRGGAFEPPTFRETPEVVLGFAVGPWAREGPAVAVSCGSALALMSLEREELAVRTTTLRVGDREIEAFVTGDFDEDGRTDLAILARQFSESSSVWFALARGNGTYELVERPAGVGASSLLARDLNGDGHLDLIIYSRERRSIWCLEGTGTGDLELGREVARPPDDLSDLSILSDDFDGDGDADLAGYVGYDRTTYVWINQGGGRLAAPVSVDSPTEIESLLSVDLDDVPGRELCVWTQAPGTLRVHHLTRDGRVLLDRVHLVLSFAFRPEFADLNGDCLADLFGTVEQGDRISYQLALPGGGFGPARLDRIGESDGWNTVGDVNGDHLSDGAWYDVRSGVFRVRLSRPEGGFAEASESQLGSRLFQPRLIDLDQDGTSEIVARDRRGGIIIVANQATDVTPPVTPPAGALWLHAVLPNPARGPIQFDVEGFEAREPIGMEVFDAQGRLVLRSEFPAAGNRTCLRWDARGGDGARVASGLYFVRVRSGSRELLARVTLVR